MVHSLCSLANQSDSHVHNFIFLIGIEVINVTFSTDFIRGSNKRQNMGQERKRTTDTDRQTESEKEMGEKKNCKEEKSSCCLLFFTLIHIFQFDGAPNTHLNTIEGPHTLSISLSQKKSCQHCPRIVIGSEVHT